MAGLIWLEARQRFPLGLLPRAPCVSEVTTLFMPKYEREFHDLILHPDALFNRHGDLIVHFFEVVLITFSRMAGKAFE